MPGQVMFRSYGLLWREDRVFWGWPKVKGHLMGREVSEVTGKPTGKDPVDFRYQIGIYALYYDFELVYIGQVGANTDDSRGKSLFDRLKDHRDGRHSERWDRFSWFGVQNVTNSKELTVFRKGALSGVTRGQFLDLFEAVVIALSEPKLNLQRGKLKNYATQYSQWYDPAELDEQAIQQNRHPLQRLYTELDE